MRKTIVRALAGHPAKELPLTTPVQNPKAVLSDLAAMLLSNLTKNETLAAQLLALRLPSAVIPEGIELPPTSSSSDLVPALDVLLDVFLKGEGKHYNKNANYDFLASVFANVSTVSRFCSGNATTADSTPATDCVRPQLPSQHLFAFDRASAAQDHLLHRAPVHHPPRRRRLCHQVRSDFLATTGSALTMFPDRNSSFDKTAHYRLLTSSREAAPEEGAIDLLPQLLLPLAGTDEFDLDVRSSQARAQGKQA